MEPIDRKAWRAVMAAAAALLLAVAARAQETSRQQALHSLAQQLQTVETDLTAARAGGDAARVQELRHDAEELQQRFANLATGFDVARIETPVAQPYDLQTELLRLVRPLVRALSSATEGPRQIQELEEHLDAVDARLAQAELVARGLERARADAPGDALVGNRLDAARVRWQAFVDDLRNDRLVTAGRVEALTAARVPVADTVQNAVAWFFQHRGASLLYAGIAALLVLVTMRFLHRSTLRLVGSGGSRLPLRLFDVAFQGLVGVVTALTVLVVFYLRGDFELLALAIVFLLGLGWALSRTLPLFVEQLRLLLNAGAVREGERLLLDGLPWRVEALRLHTRLVNPELQGGVLRIPLRDLIGKASRRFAADEPWFPSRAGDWVRLADGTFGRVEQQTPEQVVVLIEQTRRTFRTADFLAQNPVNLSAGFQVTVPFGLDYGLQAASTTEIPAQMAAALQRRLPEVDGGRHLLRVQVEFAQAGASSLDYEVRAQFDGAAAQHFGALRRAIARILVDVCSERRWTIPFPQLTVHRPE